jgi:hypothetical protein
MLSKNVSKWFIFRYPFRTALVITTTYVILGVIIARSELLDTFLYWVFAPTWIPLLGYFGINGSPSIVHQVGAVTVLILIYTLLFTLIIRGIKQYFIRT